MRSHLSQDPRSQLHNTITTKKGLFFIMDSGAEQRVGLKHENDQKCCSVTLYLNISQAFLSTICPQGCVFPKWIQTSVPDGFTELHVGPQWQ